jgi:beta-phosphoglucomutase
MERPTHPQEPDIRALSRNVIRGILCDAEGVTIDTEAVWDEAQKLFLERRGIKYDRAQLKPLLSGRTLAEGESIMHGLYHYSGDLAANVEERRALVRQLLSARTKFIPGFESFFATVSRTHAVALATAMDVELFALVDERLGLTRLFNGHVVTLPEVAFRSKPNPDLFLCAARKLGLAPANCAVIEDAPLGIRAAVNAGMVAIALTTTYDASLLTEADAICSSFPEVLAALRRRSLPDN